MRDRGLEEQGEPRGKARDSILALDYGRRRVGIAGCSGDVSIAFGIDTLIIDGLDDLMEQLIPIIRQRSISGIIVGFPITLGDKPGSLTEEIFALVRRLEEHGLSVLLVDEALSSRRASSILRQRGRSSRKEDRDRASAAVILQDFLDGHLPPLTSVDIERLRSKIDPK
jgi:putative Holliday junction resolvase